MSQEGPYRGEVVSVLLPCDPGSWRVSDTSLFSGDIINYTFHQYGHMESLNLTCAKVNLTLDGSVAKQARELGLNMSRLAEGAIVEAVRIERNRLWREKKRDAIEAYEKEVEANGLPLAEYRTF